jgi:exopolysaccharide biosynthesis polyprenyl glycosylphosphotransferase
MQQKLRWIFLGGDFLTAALSWALFFYYRKVNIEHQLFQANNTFVIGILVIPLLWLLFYTLQGTYQDIRRLYRLKVLSHTLVASIFGSVVLFFVLLLDDEVHTYKNYYQSLFSLVIVHFSLTFLVRIIIVSIVVKQVHRKKVGFKTLIIGGSEKAISIYTEIEDLTKSSGHNLVGFVNINGIDKQLEQNLEYLGHINALEEVLEKHQIEEVIIAIESTEHERLKSIVSRIAAKGLAIKILPDMYDILSGSVKLNNIFGALLIDISLEPMPYWQRIVKRVLDITLSLFAIILLIPVYLVLALAVKLSSKGPILFFQERIGKNGKPFQIIKFRTMYTDAEKEGPQLSSSNDARITKVGKFMRKSRLDEFPQFFNVLKGDMSLVGPRPERQFYIDKISAIEPQFLELTKVRPGITSWGQVKFGYAENVEQMVQRMKFDLLYLRNRSLALDFKILLYTVIIIVKAKGK